MKDAQLEKMSVKDLMALKSRIDEVIAEKEDEEKAQLKAELEERAQKMGYSIGTLFGTGGRGRGRGKPAGIVKYRNTADASQTWSGRGRKPRWILEAGGDIERFRVGR
jgi:DNA-binding protein H-NS